jgi:diguanylate cyclase (GGDEF)-like protein/PAS domain S-box-containing protein
MAEQPEASGPSPQSEPTGTVHSWAVRALLPEEQAPGLREECLSLLLEQMPALISVADDQGQLLMASAQHATLEGVASQSQHWHKLSDLFPAAFQADLEHLLGPHHLPGQMLEFKAKHKDGHFHIYQMKCLHQRTQSGGTLYFLFGSDITSHKQVENSLLDHKSRLDYMVLHDNLTGLANRSMFYDRINKSLHSAKAHSETLGILLVDLDRFKNINESLGYDAGDDLLRITADNLRAQLRESDTVARLSGDEFVVVLEDIHRRTDVEVVAQKLLNRLGVPVKLQGHQITTTASIGISIFPNDGDNIDQLLKHADLAMHKAKSLGKNRFEFFDGAMSSQAVNYLLLENDLRRAIEQREITLHYQPQINLHTGKIIGLEALVRWNSKERGMVSPMHFIPLAEETGLIEPLGEWVLHHACERFQHWLMQGLQLGKVAVNISPKQFRKEHFEHTVMSALMATRLAPEYLELEITETSAMENAEKAVDMLNCLSKLGLSIAIDDFGTGYSSLAYLKRFPIQKLKIDRSFVKDVDADSNDAAIAKSIIDLAHNMSLQVIAEGVERLTQSHWLLQRGCDQVQGFYYSKPLSEEQLMTLVKSEQVVRDATGIRLTSIRP